MDRLDPARTALLVVHMAKGVAGDVDTPFNRLFHERAEKTGVIRVQARLLDGFRKAKAKVVYTLVTYRPGLPGVRPNSPLFRTLIDSPTLLQGTRAVEVIDDIAPRPDEPVTIVVSDACQADSDEAHARALDVLKKWFSETPTANEVLDALELKAAA
jgi:nicotinamidase-related amidase